MLRISVATGVPAVADEEDPAAGGAGEDEGAGDGLDGAAVLSGAGCREQPADSDSAVPIRTSTRDHTNRSRCDMRTRLPQRSTLWMSFVVDEAGVASIA
jgi:hypothetical protein